MKARREWAWPLVPLYAAGLAVKDGLRGLGVPRTRKLRWPVVSVGSLSAGGAGKTPVVIALAELLHGRGWYVDVLSRGYGRAGSGVERVDPEAADAALRYGDEPMVIAQRTGVPVWVGAERFAAGSAAEELRRVKKIDFSDRKRKPGLKPLNQRAIQGAESNPASSERRLAAYICWMMDFSIAGWRGRWMWRW